ncbi:Altered inheritance of mitochondria protein 9, mitochondrial [Fulvia fulva]|uniref:Altered inheritance of mitochondria protein 9, mitochondrial n=1 Tax=Passalora fulva TaxID=5499 RepID=A0A9Q8UTJ4_PASFU|nr:Altered inheritance of mitochondria protein 9, mitochondrial [Fulvia fulva]UJO21852.1 Altered inheritance of mitochondria protein 9, mitochondrial [Fulvia fulva]
MLGRLSPLRSLYVLRQILQHRSFTLSTQRLQRISSGDARVHDFAEAFEYISGRWLYNEHLRLSERRLKFNITALLDAGARSIGRVTSDVRSFRKLAEGGFNRVFELTMHDGVQQLTTASEVATMDLVRSHGVPVPKVLDYSTDAANSVAAEYILTEKVCGRSLGDVWFTMSDKERLKVLSAVVDNEAKLFAIDLPASGSIFYSEDLPRTMERVALPSNERSSKTLCVGPDISPKFWFAERSQLGIQRKPFAAVTEALQGAALKEIAWLETYGKPRFPRERMYRDITNFQKSQPEEHLESLRKYLQIAPSLVPKESWLSKPTLRHPDLNSNNIFVSDDYEVVSIIDWQHSRALPLFLHTGITHHFRNFGDSQSEALVKPELPADLDEMHDDRRGYELEKYRRRHVHFYYAGATATKYPRHFDASMHEGGLFRRRIDEHAAQPWEGNSIPLKADLIHLTQEWSQFAESQDGPPPCPLSFEAEEAERVLQGALKQEEADNKLEIVRNYMEAGSDGWSARMKAQVLENADNDEEREEVERYWMFDDFDEEE